MAWDASKPASSEAKSLFPAQAQANWSEIAASFAQINSFGSIGQVSTNNSGTPTTQWDMDADVIMLRDTAGSGLVNLETRFNPGAALTNNTSTAGSTANGRDQAGAFSAGSWVHFYWIWNGTTLATLSSATAPPTGPTLPTGYTHWSYGGAVRFNGSSNLIPTRIVGNAAYYHARQSALTGGTATTETAVSLTALVPPNALESIVFMGNARSAGPDLTIRYITTLDFLFSGAIVAIDVDSNMQFHIPNVSQQIFYLWSGAPSNGIDIDIQGYVLPNGGA